MTNNKDRKRTSEKGAKDIRKQSGGMTFVVNKRKGVKAPDSVSDKSYETKGTGPKSYLVDKDE